MDIRDPKYVNILKARQTKRLVGQKIFLMEKIIKNFMIHGKSAIINGMLIKMTHGLKNNLGDIIENKCTFSNLLSLHSFGGSIPSPGTIRICIQRILMMPG